MEKGERIAKVMARSGLCSRRDAEKWILEGAVTVNGTRIDSPALNVSGADRILVRGKKLPSLEATRLWLHYKPAGLLTTHQDEGDRQTVFASLPKDMPRVISVGRLDLNTEGLLLLTNDGGLARHLELPATGWKRRYRVRIYGQLTEAAIQSLKRGVTVEGVRYGSILVEPEAAKPGARNIWAMVTLTEGKNREIRRVFEHLDCKVSRLIRVSYGPFQLGNLKEGEVREVPEKMLAEQVGNEWKA
jgi:23S rRNA pseudouridine2605 synthase